MLCGDCLISGLIVMGASLAWSAWQQGLGRQFTASCPTTAWIPPAGFLGMVLASFNPAISLIGHVLCYAKVQQLIQTIAILIWSTSAPCSTKVYRYCMQAGS